MYRLSPPKATGFKSRLRLVGTVIGASIGASLLMGLTSAVFSSNLLSNASQDSISTTASALQTTAALELLDVDRSSSLEAMDLPTVPSNGQGPVVAKRTLIHPISSGDTFGTLLTRYGVENSTQIIEAITKHFDISKIKTGKQLKFEFVGYDLMVLSYEIDADRTLKVDLADEQVHAEVHQMSWTPTLARKELVLTSSLWSAAIQAGFKPADIVTLAQIFEYDIDFGSELRNGARFTIVMDELHREDGEATKSGTFHAVRLVNGGKDYTAIRHQSANGSTGWYHSDGKATARPFLRSPLEFTRVTSRFGVNRKTHYHGGVDMGAGTGTPIRAAGDGVVVIAGRRGAYGNHVKISHARYGKYHTSYSHMSKIKVKNGQHVKQGQIIGLVGSTGRSTGPHLHYEFHIRGKRVNPMTIKLPGSKSLPKNELAAFKKVAAKWLPTLDQLETTAALVDAGIE